MSFYSEVKENIWVGAGSIAGLGVGLGASLLSTGSLFEKSFLASSIPLVPMLTASLWNTFNPNQSQRDQSLLNRGWQNLSTQVINPLIQQNIFLGGALFASSLLSSTSVADTVAGIACVAIGFVGLEVCKGIIDKRWDSSINKINRAFWIGLGCWSVYHLIDSGLAHFFALETLTHGTGPLGYIGINLHGADPNYGGGDTGSSIAVGSDTYIQKSKNFFHVFKDSAFTPHCNRASLPGICRLANYAVVLTRFHAALSGKANFKYLATDKAGSLVQSIIGAVLGLLTPTLKFRFTPEEILNCGDTCLFEEDPFYDGSAYRTSKAINPSHLGISGSISQGINSEMFNRMSANPIKVLVGIVLLGAAASAAITTYQYIKSEQEVNDTSQSTSFFQNCKKKLKVAAVNSGWATLAVTIIFLNAL